MSKPPSDKTLLATERRATRRLRNELQKVEGDLRNYRSRATKAEQESAEWKRRFDLLLERSPTTSGERP